MTPRKERGRLAVGIVGSGFLAETRARAYAAVSGNRVDLVAVAARRLERAQDYARRHKVKAAYDDYRRILDRSDVDVVDLCVPNYLHRTLTEEAASAGKHVICPKPLTAFDGASVADDVELADLSRHVMLAGAVKAADAMLQATRRAGVRLCYGENWVFAPSIVKAGRLCAASDGAILEMRGGECHSGSHSQYSRQWRSAGGGALIQLGAHPIGAMLHLKRQEGLRRLGHPIRPSSLVADVADLTKAAGFSAESKHWVGTGWVDVENWGAVVISFEDGTKGVLWASEAVLGGMESNLQLLLSNAHLKCNLSHAGLLAAYAPDAAVFAEEYLQEKLETTAGWSRPAPDEDWANGHLAMIEDFVDSLVVGREPTADGELGRDVVEVIYAAYLSAAEGRRVNIGDRAARCLESPTELESPDRGG